MGKISSSVHFDIWGDKMHTESFNWKKCCFRQKKDRTGGFNFLLNN